MATPNRATLIGRIHKTLKKHYTPVDPPDRPVLEHLLYAVCLENATYKAADEAYNTLATSFFDWNEVRVSTAKELAEAVHMLPEPATAAVNFRSVLQSVFESSYSFELEHLKKMNLGPAQEHLQKLRGVTPFAVAYVTQAALGGHSIPLDKGTLGALVVLGLITEQEAAAGAVPGMERAIPKNKGTEFGSLLHQLGADFAANPYSTNLHKLLLDIAPDAKERLPKRPPKKAVEEAPPAKAPTKTAEGAARAPAAGAEKAAEKAGDEAAKKSAAEAKKQLPEKKPAPVDKKPSTVGAKKSAAAGLSKRKPR
jgi:endonuclease III